MIMYESEDPMQRFCTRLTADEQESMMTILAIVNANKEGQIESKMMKSRHMEEIREARHKEAEARQQQKQSKLVWATHGSGDSDYSI